MKLSTPLALSVLCALTSGLVAGCSGGDAQQAGPAVGTATPGGGVITTEGRAAKGKMFHGANSPAPAPSAATPPASNP